MAASLPMYPLTVIYSTGESERFEDEEHAVLNLEWFDSEDPHDPSTVVDSLGRPCRLRIEKFQIIWLEVI